MQRALPHFQTALEETRTCYTNMTSQKEALQGSWSGQAAIGFDNALESWLMNCNQVASALQGMLDKLQGNASVYSNTHQDTVQAASNLRSEMGGLPGLGI
jgi:WXG100 family type VII secretion target